MRPDHDTMCRALGVAMVIAVAGCGGGGNGDAASPAPVTTYPAVTDAAPPDASATAVSAPAGEPGEAAPTGDPRDEASGDDGLDTSPGHQPARLEVRGGALPGPVVDGYATNGGELVDPAEWYGRFGDSVLPRIDGEGVALVEAVRRVEQRDGAWVSTDEAAWLAIVADGRDETVAELAATAGLAGPSERSVENDQGAECVVDTYPAAEPAATWQVQGCSYDQFPRMVALGVSRTGPAAGDAAPVVDTTVTSLADLLGGEVTFSEVRLGAPGRDGATLHRSAHLATDVDVATATDQVTAGPLRDWQMFTGDDSALLSGPTGATWTLSDRVAVFNWAGRW